METYTTIQGDMWDTISYKVYGHEKYMGILLQNNLDLLNIFIFPAGIEVKVPALKKENKIVLPSWRL